MRMGVSLCCWSSYDLLTALDRSIKLGFRLIEIGGDPPHAFPGYMNDELLDTILGLKNRFGLNFVFHSPNHDSNPASSNPDARKMVVKQYKDSIILGKRIGAEGIVVHTGKRSVKAIVSREEAIGNLIATLKESASVAEENNIPLLLENESIPVNGGFLQSPQDIIDILHEVDSEAIQICLDTGHAQLQNISCVDYIEKCKPKLTHVHLHDNDGSADQHLPIGHGILDIPRILDALSSFEFSGRVILEIFGGSTPDENILECLKYLDRIKKVHFECVEDLRYLSGTRNKSG